MLPSPPFLRGVLIQARWVSSLSVLPPAAETGRNEQCHWLLGQADLSCTSFRTRTLESGWNLLAQQTSPCIIKSQGPQRDTAAQLGQVIWAEASASS